MTTFGLGDGAVDAQDRVYVVDAGHDFVHRALQPVDTCVIARLSTVTQP